jgi:hypothetical protein
VSGPLSSASAVSDLITHHCCNIVRLVSKSILPAPFAAFRGSDLAQAITGAVIGNQDLASQPD